MEHNFTPFVFVHQPLQPVHYTTSLVIKNVNIVLGIKAFWWNLKTWNAQLSQKNVCHGSQRERQSWKQVWKRKWQKENWKSWWWMSQFIDSKRERKRERERERERVRERQTAKAIEREGGEMEGREREKQRGKDRQLKAEMHKFTYRQVVYTVPMHTPQQSAAIVKSEKYRVVE